jgi:hypothetical protein
MPGKFNTATGAPVNGRAIIPVLARFSFFCHAERSRSTSYFVCAVPGENNEVLRLRFESAKLRSE